MKNKSITKEDKLIKAALRCLENRLYYDKTPIETSAQAMNYVRLRLAPELNEVFAVFFLDAQHRVIAFEKLFFGTVNSSFVHPRVIVKKALEHNAVSVILAHNHPSGSTEASPEDRKITDTLTLILNIIDVEILDHFIVTPDGALSFAEKGYI